MKTETKSGLGLEGIGDLSELLNASEGVSGQPLLLAMNLIDEDPDQPRAEDNPGFSEESIAELAVTIKERSVKSPISVRTGLDGRYVINHGARRYRASQVAGKDVIPAFIDDDYTEIDQVIENLQRNKLTAREIADVIGRELAKGEKKGAIAKSLGKSPAFVTQHLTLLDLPGSIAVAVTAARSSDVTVINEMVTAFKQNPEAVEEWLADENQEVTRGTVKLLREFINDKKEGDDAAEEEPEQYGKGSDAEENKEINKKVADPNKIKKAILLVIHDERPARVIMDRRPEAEGFGWLKYEDDGEEFSTDLGDVRILSIIEGT